MLVDESSSRRMLTSSMVNIVAQIAPQRSTQYANLAGDLADVELLASPVGRTLTSLSMEEIAHRHYLRFAIPGPSFSTGYLRQLASMAMIGSVFELFDSIGDVRGPLLRPISLAYPFFITPDLASIRRYKGKTSEFFTQFLCNIAKFASDFADAEWRGLRLLDPLCGGGTTLFAALSLGADVAGIELNRTDVETTAAFVGQFCRENRIPVSLTEERLRRSVRARRWFFRIGKDDPRCCLLVHGDAVEAPALVSGFGNPHLIVADLPYGIQHSGPLVSLLTNCLPVWKRILEPGGTIAFSWDSTRFTRAEMVELVTQAAPLDVVQRPPYDRVAHRVDRVIKRRDVIVARARVACRS
jgi:SAM-dependent methyltransferase